MRSPNHPSSPSKPADRTESAALPESAREETAVQAAVPPTIDPDHFERFEGFRETTLAIFTDVKANATLRGMADFIYTVCLEYSQYWPAEPEGSFRHQCRAAVADLRHLQGYLAMLGQFRFDASLSDEEDQISALCGRLSPRLKKVADALEKALVSRAEEE
jgi:hypothetical protein